MQTRAGQPACKDNPDYRVIRAMQHPDGGSLAYMLEYIYIHYVFHPLSTPMHFSPKWCHLISPPYFWQIIDLSTIFTSMQVMAIFAQDDAILPPLPPLTLKETAQHLDIMQVTASSSIVYISKNSKSWVYLPKMVQSYFLFHHWPWGIAQHFDTPHPFPSIWKDYKRKARGWVILSLITPSQQPGRR